MRAAVAECGSVAATSAVDEGGSEGVAAQVRVAAQVWGAGCKAAAKRIGWRCSRFGWRRRLGWLAVAAQAGLAAQVGVVGRRTLGIKPICAGCASCVCSALDIGPGQQQMGRGTLSHLPGDSIRSGSLQELYLHFTWDMQVFGWTWDVACSRLQGTAYPMRRQRMVNNHRYCR